VSSIPRLNFFLPFHLRVGSSFEFFFFVYLLFLDGFGAPRASWPLESSPPPSLIPSPPFPQGILVLAVVPMSPSLFKFLKCLFDTVSCLEKSGWFPGAHVCFCLFEVHSSSTASFCFPFPTFLAPPYRGDNHISGDQLRPFPSFFNSSLVVKGCSLARDFPKAFNPTAFFGFAVVFFGPLL